VPIKTDACFLSDIPSYCKNNKILTFVFCLYIYRTLGSDDYNDVRLGGHGTLHGYSNCVNPFLEVNIIFNMMKFDIHF
jgi:hypothetical protein